MRPQWDWCLHCWGWGGEGRGRGTALMMGRGHDSTSVYNNCCLVLVQELGMPLTTHYLLFHHDLHYSLSLPAYLFSSFSPQLHRRERSIAEASDSKICSFYFYYFFFPFFLQKVKSLRFYLIQSLVWYNISSRKAPCSYGFFSPAVLLLIRKALLLFCRRRNLYKWSGHHACVSCSVPRLLIDLEL